MKNVTLKNIQADRSLDVRGLDCPLPLVKAKKAITSLGSGQVLEILGTCPGSKNSFPQWAQRTGNEYLGLIDTTDCYKFYLKKS